MTESHDLSLQAGDAGRLVCSSKDWEPGALRAGENGSFSSAVRQRGKFNFSSPFCSMQAFNRLYDAHPHWGQPSAYSVHQFKS